jgi:uncharacterized protein (DUF1015 family)
MSTHLRIRAFQGLVPAPQHADEVNCVPYDVLDTAEARVLAEGRPFSLLHVDRAEIDLPPETDIHSDAVYAKAAENFRMLQDRGALVREKAPSLYLYRQVMGGHSQIGLAAVVHVDDYDADLIKKHEKTRKDKEDDRTRLIDTIGATTGPVFLTYRGRAEIDALVLKETTAAPVYDFTAPDGVRHTVWRVADPAAFEAAFGEVPHCYIADGHHRAASAARVARDRRGRNPHHTGNENYNWFLGVLFPADQLRILPYNRAVADLNGHTPEAFLALVKERFGLEPDAGAAAAKPGDIRMYFQGRWYGLKAVADDTAGPVGRLDVSVLQDKLLAPVLGIDDPRTSKRIEFIGGIRGTGELEKKVQSGRAAVAFSMFPTTVDQMMDIADAGEIMPPKSTWFEPKLRSGFFIHTLD